MPVWVALVGSYLVGGLDFGRVFRQMEAIDGSIPELSSGHTLMASFGNVLKGVLAVTAGWWADGWGDPAMSAVAFACGFAAVLGHTFPVFHRFVGTPARATAFGAAVFLIPVPTLAVAAVAVAVRRVAGSLDWATWSALVAAVPAIVLANIGGWPLVWLSAMLLLVLIGQTMTRFGSSLRNEEQLPE